MKTLFKDITLINNKDKTNVLVNGKRIEKIGNDIRCDDADRIIDGRGKLLMPGLYNAHCHSAMTLFRGYGEDLPLDRWLNEKIFPAEDLLTSEAVYAGSKLAIAEMIKNGIVSFTDMYNFCDDTAKAVIETGIKANLGRAMLSFDPSENLAESDRFKEAASLADDFNGAADGKLKIDMAIHAEYTNNENSASFVAEYAAKNGLGIQIHLSETEKEHRECIERHGKTPAQFFLDTHVFDVPVSAAHCVYVTDEDMDIMVSHKVTAVHNPTSNLKLGSGVMPLRKMLDKGVNVALGTDGVASNNTLDIFKELSLASILHKGISRKADITTASEMIKLATENGAISQQRYDCGKIEVGALADLVLIDLNAVNNIPMYDTASAVCYSVNSSNVLMTMADGKVLYENGEYKTLDIEKVKYDIIHVLEHYFD